jgi:hypothetical protein
MDGTTGAEKADQWTWFATKDPAFITNGALNTASALTTASGDLLNVSSNYNTASGTNSVEITWSPQVLANTVYQGSAGQPTFVVGYATGENCADNIKVYEINPIMSFIVDIAAIDEKDATLAWDTPAEECVSPVVGATYSAGKLDMNYGTDSIYFEIVAANFVKNFKPSLDYKRIIRISISRDRSCYISGKCKGRNICNRGNHYFSCWSRLGTGIAFDAVDPAQVASGVSCMQG